MIKKIAGVLISLLMAVSIVGCTRATSGTTPNSQITAQSVNTTKATAQSQTTRASGSPNSRPAATAATGTSAVVVKGDGVVAVVNYANLYFGTGGKIEKIYVKEGDLVVKGDPLGKLDTTNLTVSAAQAKITLDTAQIAQKQAYLSMQTAQMTLDKNKIVSDENDKVANIKMQIKAIQSITPNFTADYCAQLLKMSQQDLDNENKNLAALLGQTDDAAANAYISSLYSMLAIQDIRTLYSQVKSAQKTLDSAQATIDQAQSNYNLIQKQFDDASIKAPFNGTIATINYSDNDIVPAPSPTQPPVIYLVDPGSLAVNINVNELDIPKIKIGQAASVSVLAFSGTKFDGKITAISSLSAIQGRMVNYNATVGLSVPANIQVRAGMDASVQITVADSVTPQTTPSQSPGKTTPPAQTTRSTAPDASSTGTANTTPVVAAGNAQGAIKSTGSITDLAYANLYFGTGGKIEMLNVKPGDKVVKGTVIAKLDTSSLDTALAQAKLTLDQAQLAKTQAVTALQTAQTTLDKTQTLIDAKTSIFDTQWQIRVQQIMALDPAETGITYRMQTVTAFTAQANSKIKAFTTLLAQPEFSGVVTYDLLNSKYDTLIAEDISIKTTQIQIAQKNIDKAQDTIDQAQINLNVAQKQLNDAIIKAPFDGLVTTLNYNKGDTLSSPSSSQRPVIYMVDPGAKAVIVTVNELDMTSMKIGQQATINIDAFPGVDLKGEVTAISAVPTVRGGIVDYSVTITLMIPPNVEIKSGMNASAQIKTN